MHALLRYPRSQRRAVACEWARRSNAGQALKRMERGPNAETMRWRALHDARGQVLAHGCRYSASGAVAWEITRSRHGRINQVDLVISGQLFRTGSLRSARRAVRTCKWLAVSLGHNQFFRATFIYSHPSSSPSPSLPRSMRAGGKDAVL